MVGSLANVAKRLSGDGGEPVIQLQTVFGGGKTHSMLAPYHLFGPEKPLDRVTDGEKIIRESGLSEMPVANRYALVDTDLDVSAHPCTS